MNKMACFAHVWQLALTNCICTYKELFNFPIEGEKTADNIHKNIHLGVVGTEKSGNIH